jgi:hypothetical protein
MTTSGQLPPPGTVLSDADAKQVAADWRAWHGELSDVLLALDERSRQLGLLLTEVAEVFVSWTALGDRISELEDLAGGGRTRDLVARAWQSVTRSDGSELGADLSTAGHRVLDTCVGLQRQLADAHADQAGRAAARAQGDDDVAISTRLAAELGEEAANVARLAERWSTVTDDERVTIASQLAAVRRRLEQSNAERISAEDRLEDAAAELDELRASQQRAADALTSCRDKIVQAPRMAVPSVDALGPAPTIGGRPWSAVRGDVMAWLGRVDRLPLAFAEIERRCRDAIGERDELRGRLQAFRDKAAASGTAEHPEIDGRYLNARTTLWSAPCDLDAARTQVADYVATVNRTVGGRA